MSIETDLKKDGITVIKQLDTLSTTLIAKFVAEKYISYFPFCHMKYNDLFTKVSRLHMYIADIPQGMSEANYFFKNESIYFKKGLSMEEMKELTIHEFMHHYQEKKDKNNLLYRFGLADFTNLKIKGLAMNEAAVQLLSSKILHKEEDIVKYYGIEFRTVSPNYYPLLCNLIEQMAYITGNNVLIDSTLHANDKFKNCFIKLCGKKNYDEIERNFDKILKIEENVIVTNSLLQQTDLSEKQLAKISTKIENNKVAIRNIFVRTQNLILTSYFDNAIQNIYSEQDIEDYRTKLYSFKDYVGTTENDSFFNKYYINMMTKLDEIYDNINNTALTVYSRSKFDVVLSKFSKLFGRGLETENVYKY